MKSHKRQQLGSVSVEYVVISMFIVVLLFTPLGDTGSVVDMVVDAYKNFQAHTLYLLSMP